MKLAVLVLCLLGCKSADKTPPRAASGSAPGSGDAAVATVVDAAQVAPPAVDAAPVATSRKACCCESTGDATHYTLEGSEAACTADDMRGSCVALEECELDAEPKLLVAGSAVTVPAGGLVAMWATKEPKAFAAVALEPAGADATVRTYGSDSPDGWKKHGKVPVAPGPLTVTAQTDGTAVVTNGKTTWVLAQQDRYGKVTFTKRK